MVSVIHDFGFVSHFSLLMIASHRYDKYASDRHTEPRGRPMPDRYAERSGYDTRPDERRRGGAGGRDMSSQMDPATLAQGKDIASELKNMLFTLLKNHQK